MSKRILVIAGIAALGLAGAHPALAARKAPPAPAVVRLRVNPSFIHLSGRYASQGVSVLAVDRAGHETDVSSRAQLRAVAPRVSVEAGPVLSPVADGKTVLEVKFGGQVTRVPVVVSGSQVGQAPEFERDVQPVLTKAGCNQGACHGKAAGQNGFRLSLLGWDLESDYGAIAHEAGSRRINRAAPAGSLVLLKATATVQHGGGRRLRKDSSDYRILRDWIATGLTYLPGDSSRVTALEVWPPTRVAHKGSANRMLVTARYADGSRRDVTSRALYLSNDLSVAQVDDGGTVRVERDGGEAPVMVRYAGLATIARIVAPLPARARPYPVVATDNPIDAAIFGKLKTLNIEPSRLTLDTEFLRRATLDGTGRLPTPDEIRTFVADASPQKRARKIDSLLDSAAYADWWTLKWGDILQVRTYYDNEAKLSQPFFQWLHQAVSDNMPADRLAASVIAAAGTVRQHGPVDYYQRLGNTGLTQDTLMVQLCQAFLGVRIRCAQCHHHPYDKWGQDDYWGMASIFQRLQIRDQRRLDLKPEVELARNPRTGKSLKPTPLGGRPFEPDPNIDPRVQLADWLSQPENPFFSRALANRIWEQLFGRGLVDPVDDLRDTNPASHPELLTALAKDLVDHHFDVKHLVKEIMLSRAYQLSSDTNATNEADTVFVSHARTRRLPAEALLDAIVDATGVPQQFRAPYGTRAVQLPDPNHGSEFLTLFGRPSRDTPCECDRKNDSSIPIALHLMNGDTVANRISSDRGRVARLLKANTPDDGVLDDLFLSTVSRLPNDRERKAAHDALAKADKPQARKEVFEDILWALLNSKEFLFNT